MNNDEAINPMVFFGAGCCAECGGPLVIVDMETSFMQVSDQGIPVNEETMYKCKGVCRSCHKEFDMCRYKDGYAYTTPETEILRNMEYEYEVRERMDHLKNKKDNPFAI